MKFYSRLIIAFVFSSLGCFAQNSLKTCTANRVTKAPRIDGLLDEEAWQNVSAVSDFVQGRPLENTPPSFITEVKVTYDDNAIYVGAFMHDPSPDSILHELGARDAEDLNADLFQFKIDPYNTRQDAFIFGVWASGVQIDNKWTDNTFNAVWISAVAIVKDGWIAEFKIPFSAIRFPKKEIQKWGVQFTRNIRRTREFDQWSYTPSGSANPLNFWGNLEGISNIKTPIRLSMTPYLSGYAEQTPYLDHDGTIDQLNSFSYNIGADIKYGIDDRFTLDLTLLPDFGQVQSDSKIKNLGFREVTYNENRSFFREGTELFSKNGLFYSRRIGKVPGGFYSLYDKLEKGDSVISNPSQVKLINAAKVSGRTNSGLGIGIFNAVTADMYAVVQDSLGERRKILTEPLTNFNILVLDQQLKNNSNIYFINTNVIRDKTFKDANVSGAGFTFFNHKSTFAIDGLGELSQRLEKIEGSQDSYTDQLGYKYFLGVRKSSGRVQFGVSRKVTSSGIYTSDLGFQTIPNIVGSRAYVDYYQFKPNRFIREGNQSLSVNYDTHFLTKKATNLELNYNAFASLLNYNAIFGGAGLTPLETLDYNEPRVPGRYAKSLRYYYAFIGFSTDYRKKVAIDLTQNMSNFIDHFKTEGYNTDVSIRYRASNKLNVKYAFSFYYDPFNYGFADIDANGDVIYGGRKLHTYINLLSANYIFTKDMSLSLVARHYWNTGQYRAYFKIEEDGSFTQSETYSGDKNFNYNAFNVDFVYAWIFAPGSTLSLVYKNAIEQEEAYKPTKFNTNLNNTLNAPQSNSLSLKLLYFLDYLYLKKKTGLA
jgi:Domain of unknown function (DUF5916)/Carbohydrate family 9 binding domain-like